MDVDIVGGGPAGLVSGITLLRHGHRVRVWEEHETIGEPVQCAGIVSVEAFHSLKEIRSSHDIILNTITGARIHAPSGEVFVVNGGRVRAYVIDRCALDQRLSQTYLEEGGVLILGKRAKPHHLTRELIVGADGPSSKIAEHFSFPPISCVFGYQLEAEGPLLAQIIEKHYTDVFLSSSLFPGFFGWVIPLNEERARIGFAAQRGTSLSLTMKRFLRFLSLPEDTLRNVVRTGGPIPISPRSRTSKKVHGKRHVLLVGDAAGQVKASTGGGIFYGTMAARILGENPLTYEEQWRKQLLTELRFHQMVRMSLNLLSDPLLNRTFPLFKKLRFDTFLEKYGSMDFVSPMIVNLPRYLLTEKR